MKIVSILLLIFLLAFILFAICAMVILVYDYWKESDLREDIIERREQKRKSHERID